MANEYIINKWRLWFRAMNRNHTGKISKADVEQEQNTFAELSHLEGKRKREMQENLDKLWNEYIFRGTSGPIDEQKFVDMNISDYTSNKEKFAEGMRKCYTAFFDVIDISREGSISEEEFANMMRAACHDNMALVTKFFNAYDPVDRKVSTKVLVDSWVQFTSCDDNSKTDVVKDALESGI